jgi:hypothetical protein
MTPEPTPLTPEIRAACLEALADTQTRYGSSRWAEYRRCQLGHHLRYTLRVQPAGIALHFGVGRLMHAALGYVQLGVLAEAEALAAGLPAPPQRDWRHLLDVAAEDVTVTAESAQASWRLLAAYDAHWGLSAPGNNAGWPLDAELLGVEVPLEAEIAGTPYTARADTVLRIGGRLVIPDTKTRAGAIPGAATSRSPADPEARAAYIAGLRTREQFVGLSWLAWETLGEREAGNPPPAVLVNAIIKTKIVGFDRFLVNITEADIDAWLASHAEHVTACGGVLAGRLSNYSQCSPDFGSECWALGICAEARRCGVRLSQCDDGAVAARLGNAAVGTAWGGDATGFRVVAPAQERGE